MTLRPCIDCGEPCNGPRCTEHTIDTKPSATARGYDAKWDALSRRARWHQPFCSDCGATADLQCDHLPSAWRRKAAGLPIRMRDVDVVCGPCNRSRGAARGDTTRGEGPSEGQPDPTVRQSLRFTS